MGDISGTLAEATDSEGANSGALRAFDSFICKEERESEVLLDNGYSSAIDT